MTLRKCPQCGAEVQSFDQFCAHCAYWFDEVPAGYVAGQDTGTVSAASAVAATSVPGVRSDLPASPAIPNASAAVSPSVDGSDRTSVLRPTPAQRFSATPAAGSTQVMPASSAREEQAPVRHISTTRARRFDAGPRNTGDDTGRHEGAFYKRVLFILLACVFLLAEAALFSKSPQVFRAATPVDTSTYLLCALYFVLAVICAVLAVNSGKRPFSGRSRRACKRVLVVLAVLVALLSFGSSAYLTFRVMNADILAQISTMVGGGADDQGDDGGAAGVEGDGSATGVIQRFKDMWTGVSSLWTSSEGTGVGLSTMFDINEAYRVYQSGVLSDEEFAAKYAYLIDEVGGIEEAKRLAAEMGIEGISEEATAAPENAAE